MRVTMTNLGSDDISIHYLGQQASPLCVLDRACLKYFLSKEFDTEGQTHAQWGDFVMKFVLTGGRPNWILFEHGRIVKPLVVFDKEAFLWLKEILGFQLSRQDQRDLEILKKEWEAK